LAEGTFSFVPLITIKQLIMALYRATVKNKVWANGVRLEKGMSVEFVYGSGGAPLQTNGGKEVVY
jgi:hypothetical protein